MNRHSLLEYIGELVFNLLILVGAVKASDRIVKEMMGVERVRNYGWKKFTVFVFSFFPRIKYKKCLYCR